LALGSILSGAAVVVLNILYSKEALKPDTTIVDTIAITGINFPKVDLAILASKKFFLNIANNGGIAPQYNFTNATFLNASSIIFSDFSDLSISSEFSESISFFKLGESLNSSVLVSVLD